jgi:hypothetical protein
VPDPVIALFTEQLTEGGTSQRTIEILSQLNISTCHVTAKDLVNAALERSYNKTIAYVKNYRDDSDYFLLIILDNFHIFDICREAMKFKLNTDTIDSLTNLFIFFLKTLEFKEVSANPNRIPLMPHFEDANLLDFVERYIQSGSNSEFVVTMNGLFKECIIPCTVKSSLLHYQTIGNMPMKSSLLTTGIQGIIKLIIEGFFGQQNKEVVLPLDPEFTCQMIRFNTTLFDQVKMLFFAPPIFHLMKHAIESLQKNMVFLNTVFLPIVLGAGMHSSKFKGMDVKGANYVIKMCHKQGITIESHLQPVIDRAKSTSDGCQNKDHDNKEEGEGESEDDGEDIDEDGILLPNESPDDESDDVPNFSQTQSSHDDSNCANGDRGGGCSKDELDVIMLGVLRDMLKIFNMQDGKKKKRKRKKNPNNNNDSDNLDETEADDFNDTAFLKDIALTPKRIMYIYRLLYYAFQELKMRRPEIFDTNNTLVKMVESLFESLVLLCVKPFDDCVANGNANGRLRIVIPIFNLLKL